MKVVNLYVHIGRCYMQKNKQTEIAEQLTILTQWCETKQIYRLHKQYMISSVTVEFVTGRYIVVCQQPLWTRNHWGSCLKWLPLC